MEKIIIYIDGGSRGNPGQAASAAVFCNQNGQSIKEYSQYLGISTNNEAEYNGLLLALKKSKSLFGKDKVKKMIVEIRSDSELLVKQMNGEYKIMDSKIQALFLQAWNLKIDFGKVEFVQVAREMNKKADALVNETLDNESKNQKLL